MKWLALVLALFFFFSVALSETISKDGTSLEVVTEKFEGDDDEEERRLVLRLRDDDRGDSETVLVLEDIYEVTGSGDSWTVEKKDDESTFVMNAFKYKISKDDNELRVRMEYDEEAAQGSDEEEEDDEDEDDESGNCGPKVDRVEFRIKFDSLNDKANPIRIETRLKDFCKEPEGEDGVSIMLHWVVQEPGETDISSPFEEVTMNDAFMSVAASTGDEETEYKLFILNGEEEIFVIFTEEITSTEKVNKEYPDLFIGFN